MSHLLTPPRAVLLLAAALFLWQLGGHDLWAPDEPYFAEGAREMVVDGEWAVPHVNGKVTSDKPPLFFWLIALCSLAVGEVTPWTARLPSALAGLATVALTMRLGARFAGPRTAAVGGLILCTTYMFWEKARWSQTDAVLCCLIWVALSAFEAFRSGGASGRGSGLLFWLALALAVLVKGPVGLLLPLGVVVVTLGVDRDLARLRRFSPLAGPLLFAVVVGTWMVLATVGGGGEYSVWGALREHFVDRALRGLDHEQPPWYFLEVLPANLLPWTVLAPGALTLAFRRRSGSDRFLLAATLFVVLFFSISTEKRELYALPALPALALLEAGLVAAACRWDEARGGDPEIDRRWVTVGEGVVGGLLAAVGLAVPMVARDVAPVPFWTALVVAAVLVAGGAAVLGLAWRGRPLFATMGLAGCAAAAYLAVAILVYPSLEGTKSARAFSMLLKDVTSDSRARGLPVVAYELINLPEAFAFYTGGLYTVETGDAAVLAAHLERSEAVFAAVDGGELDAVPAGLLERLNVVGAARLSRLDILLVTNGDYPGSRPLVVGR
jgi:4-amino-4-deoxy-L-arabinose transferase-like glycosyltransferase